MTVFAPLTTSPPDDIGSGAAVLRLLASGHELNDTGIALWPGWATTGTGTEIRVDTGSGQVALPAFTSFGHDSLVGLVVDDEGYGLAPLPRLTSAGFEPLAFTPDGGFGDAPFPALTTSGLGTERDVGAGAVTLPALRAFGSELGGDSGIASLPALLTVGLETVAFPSVRFTLNQPESFITIFAAEEFFATGTSTLQVTDTLTADVQQVFVSALRLLDALQVRVTTRAEAAAQLALRDALTTVALAVAGDTLTLDASLDGQALRLALLVDRLLLSDATLAQQDVIALLTAALLLFDRAEPVEMGDALSALLLGDTLEQRIALFAPAVSALLAASTAVLTLRVTALLSDALDLSAASTAQAQLQAALASGVLLRVSASTGDTTFTGWVLNPATAAMSEYTEYPFNGFVQWNDRYYGTADNGLFLLEGDTDAGQPINAVIRTALNDFGTGRMKRVPQVYIGCTTSGTLALKVVTTLPGGQRHAHVYELKSTPSSATAPHRITPGKGLKAVYWEFELANVDGADFELDVLTLVPMVLDRRL